MSYVEDYAKPPVAKGKRSFGIAFAPPGACGAEASITRVPRRPGSAGVSTQVDAGVAKVAEAAVPRALYTPEQRRRRDASVWTLVQGVLAPVQFAILLVSLGLVAHFLLTGRGLALATASVVAKTAALYAIMVTGSIWEKAVFGRYLFAPAFFWEDVVSMGVLALHTAYLGALLTGALAPRGLMLLALAAYATYLVNAGQFVLKLRAARLQGSRARASA